MNENTPVVLTAIKDGVCRLTLNRPERHNSLNEALIRQISLALDELAETRSVRVVVLSGQGASFCAGGDLNWMKDQFDASRQERIKQAMSLANMLFKLNTLGKPVVARINGNAFGGGVGVIAACDYAIASEQCRFGLTETRLGLIPATISPFVNARIGEGQCRALYLTASIFDGELAKDVGLINELSTVDALDERVDKVVSDLLMRSPEALGRAKRLARSQGPLIDQARLVESAEALADTWDTDDAIEGVAAFLDKRPAVWPSG